MRVYFNPVPPLIDPFSYWLEVWAQYLDLYTNPWLMHTQYVGHMHDDALGPPMTKSRTRGSGVTGKSKPAPPFPFSPNPSGKKPLLSKGGGDFIFKHVGRFPQRHTMRLAQRPAPFLGIWHHPFSARALNRHHVAHAPGAHAPRAPSHLCTLLGLRLRAHRSIFDSMFARVSDKHGALESSWMVGALGV